MLNATNLRHRVELQSRVETVDELGQPSTSWLTTASVWADIRYQSGLSSIKSGADVSIVKVSIRMRHRAVNAGQRITHDGVAFNIESVLPDARRAYVDCVCEVINAQTS